MADDKNTPEEEVKGETGELRPAPGDPGWRKLDERSMKSLCRMSGKPAGWFDDLKHLIDVQRIFDLYDGKKVLRFGQVKAETKGSINQYEFDQLVTEYEQLFEHLNNLNEKYVKFAASVARKRAMDILSSKEMKNEYSSNIAMAIKNLGSVAKGVKEEEGDRKNAGKEPPMDSMGAIEEARKAVVSFMKSDLAMKRVIEKKENVEQETD